MKKWLIAILALLALPGTAWARGRIMGWCQDGNQTVVVQGISARTTEPKMQRSYPSCIVTVYISGGVTLASIYANDIGTAKANPFTAASSGQWFFYADDGRYDVVLSGGGITAPFTLWDFPLIDPKRPLLIRNAADFPGADCAAKIAAAEADIGATPGEIWVNQNCGLVSTTALTISNDNHVLRFIQSGTYTFSSLLTLSGNNTTLSCSTRGDDNWPGTTLKEANGSNLATFMAASGYGVRIENCDINGNKTNNPTAQDGIVATGGKFQLYNSMVHDFKRHNWVLGGSTQATRTMHSHIFNAGSNGLEIQTGATDLFSLGTEYVNNSLYQVHSTGNVGGLHFIGGDLSGLLTGSHCVFLDGAGASVNTPQFVGVNINPCGGHAIAMVNANQFVISGVYITNPGQLANNTYDGININNYGDGTISGVTIVDGGTACSGHSCMRYGVNISSGSQSSTLSGLKIRGWQTAPWNVQDYDSVSGVVCDNTGSCQNLSPNSLRIGTSAKNTSFLEFPYKAAATTTILYTGVQGDAANRLTLNADGTQTFGGGAVAGDATVSRSGVSTIRVSDLTKGANLGTIESGTGKFAKGQYPVSGITLSNGQNDDVAIGAFTYIRVTGPTGAFSVSGFAGGIDGRLLILQHLLLQTMTIKFTTGSVVANQINTTTGADVVCPNATKPCTAMFIYDSAAGHWQLISVI